MTNDRPDDAEAAAQLARVLAKLEQALEGLDALGLKAAGARLSLVIEELRDSSVGEPS